MTLLLVAACVRRDGQSEPVQAPTSVPQPTVVHTAGGAVRGFAGPGYRVFDGIPYAAPPVGPLRWQPPAPVLPWPGVRDATKPGLRCPQDVRNDPDYGRPTGEDCLNLNVWTPDGATPSNRLPVMVWIHGGGFLNGSADIYDARWMATQGGIVVVTVNYRLGTLGFLAHPALGLGGDIGNYGLADQQAALRWVRDNVSEFGGDPTKVTIAGESAGAMSVCDHLVAPESAGLFRAAILQSGPCQAQAGRTVAERVSAAYAAHAGCTDPATVAACLRSLPARDLQRPPLYVGLGPDELTGPVTGTVRLPVDPMTEFGRNRVPRTPVLIGSNSDEFAMFAAIEYLKEHRMRRYPELLTRAFGADATAVAQRYPVERFGGNVGVAYSAAVTDSVFACPADRVASDLARTGPVYGYEFNDRSAPAPDVLRLAPFPVGASHSLELRYLFDVGGAPPLDPAQRALSDQMVAYWSQFVKTGAPEVTGEPVWPQLGADASTAKRMSLQTGKLSITTDFSARHQCPFWASLAGKR
ncbi:carboxylesterase family protein [Mycolicibacterium sp. CH28]|uniref:carboxylesterase/lipase family protein n=1 Tax=Mycolicibacterium sp. CH28 TaxID=2512237 RepID=UPI00108040C8|nr:carboxylesterase/lipase family protein [Mycolicibacterium sp. CH28]TGD85713.1 carboxylesterase family protein [Mycolicibacterium sp. CH28]